LKNLRKFFLLKRRDRRLLLTSIGCLWTARLGLWLLPFQTVRRLIAKFSPPKLISSKETSSNVERIAWAVAVASCYVPAATCLTQALAGQILLAQHGEPALLQIGVAKNEAGALQAHAWVESRGRIVIGASPELFRYTRLPSVEGKLL
jgi:Transglutaminase-like superfamily